MARPWGALFVVLAVLACTPGTAAAAWTAPVSQTEAPPQLRLTPRAAIAIADRTEAVRDERARPGRLRAVATYDIVKLSWQVDYRRAGETIVRVEIDDTRSAVTGAWRGDDIEWQMARGQPGQFGRKLNAPYVWLPLCLLFLAPFFDFRRPFRMLHLDLLAVLAFGISHIWFNKGDIGVSVPLAYPVLAYLFARMLWLATRGRGSPGPLVPHVPVVLLTVALVFLLTFRVALNVADSGVTDVGFAGVIGAERIVSGDDLYGGRFPESNPAGNTYGPVNYLAYIPFELAFPWSGRWDDLPAAHAATIAFDLLTVLALFALGRSARRGREGTTLGLALAFAWVACPYTTFVTQSNTNDALVSLLVVLALLAFRRPAASGALTALAGAAKFVPFVLVPLMARGLRGRDLAMYALGAGAVVAATFRSVRVAGGPGRVLGPHPRGAGQPVVAVLPVGAARRPPTAAAGAAGRARRTRAGSGPERAPARSGIDRRVRRGARHPARDRPRALVLLLHRLVPAAGPGRRVHARRRSGGAGGQPCAQRLRP